MIILAFPTKLSENKNKVRYKSIDKKIKLSITRIQNLCFKKFANKATGNSPIKQLYYQKPAAMELKHTKFFKSNVLSS